MGKVTATTERTIDAAPEKVRALVADYRESRPKILTEQFRDFEVTEGGKGAGTIAKWKLQATSKRVRDIAAKVSEPEPGMLVETDANSTMVTTWTIRELGAGSRVRIESTWNGASGIGGFFEKTFAPKGLKRIYDGMLIKLDDLVREQA